jgi:hypothetical protein
MRACLCFRPCSERGVAPGGLLLASLAAAASSVIGAALGSLALSTTAAWPAGGRPFVPGCALAEASPEGRAGWRGGGCGLAPAPAAAVKGRAG